MAPWEEYLESIYYDPKHPGSLSGPSKLYQAVRSEGKFRIGLRRIKTWLKGQETYTMTHQVRRKFPRNRYAVEGIDSHWQADLMDMKNLAGYNNGIQYLLVIIDLFSRFVWVYPLKDKKAQEMVKALKLLWESQPRRPKVFQSDSGSEFKNRWVKDFLKEREVVQLFSLNETKAAYAERAIKTIKMRLYRYMLKHFTYRYADVLNDVVKSYNHTKHRALGQAPSEVNEENEAESRLDQYLIRTKYQAPPRKNMKRKYTFKVGDKVRISHLRQAFDREYQEKWTGEIFTVVRRYWVQSQDVYKLKDWGGDPIEGTFYAAELQPVTEDPNQEYRIQEVVKKRSRNKRKEVLVKWMHWPKKYNSWIPEEDVKHYQQV